MDETTFRAQLAQDGFSEVLVRELAADAVIPEHQHAWDARLMVLQGELTLDRASGSVRFAAGEHCEVPRGELHVETHGPAGCSLLIGRRR